MSQLLLDYLSAWEKAQKAFTSILVTSLKTLADGIKKSTGM
jgi:hypothetical protein